MDLNKRGMRSPVSWLVSMCIVLILGLYVNVLGVGVESEWQYEMTADQSTRECNIALMNLMKSEALSGYAFAQEISIDELGVEIEVNLYIQKFFQNSEFRISSCSDAEDLNHEFVCCSQLISSLEGEPIPVSLLFKIHPDSEEVVDDE
jgi:hypothetical protein